MRRGNGQVALVLESPSSTSMKMLPCDAERGSRAGRTSHAGGSIANFHIDDVYVDPRWDAVKQRQLKSIPKGRGSAVKWHPDSEQNLEEQNIKEQYLKEQNLKEQNLKEQTLKEQSDKALGNRQCPSLMTLDRGILKNHTYENIFICIVILWLTAGGVENVRAEDNNEWIGQMYSFIV